MAELSLNSVKSTSVKIKKFEHNEKSDSFTVLYLYCFGRQADSIMLFTEDLGPLELLSEQLTNAINKIKEEK